jgi:hypothetical protein
MRRAMHSRQDLSAPVFIGGMEGVLEEHTRFTELHPTAKVLSVPAPGDAARRPAAAIVNRPSPCGDVK